MKRAIKYIASVMVGTSLLTSCGDDFVRPPMVVPTATIEANTTLLELKTAYWKSDRNYVENIGLTVDGEHTVIKGRVISSDETGNIYKSFMISDGTAALTVAVNAYDLYQTYQFGQEIVIDATDLQIGGYNGLMQLGGEGTYNGAPSMTFAEETVFAAHSQPNGLADPQLVDTLTVTIPDVVAAQNTNEGLIKWQSQLVRFDEVSWEEAGQPYAGASSTNRYIKDARGNRLLVRNSSYASFKNELLPTGTGAVVGILSYYGTDWQLLLIDAAGSIGFDETSTPDNPATPDTPGVSDGDGTEAKPFSAAQIIAMNPTSTTEAVKSGVWVKGYIVGSMPTGGSSTTLSATVFGTDDAATSNMVIADSKDVTDPAHCVGIQLTAAYRDALSLASKPENLGKEVMIYGDVMKYCGGPGVKNMTAFKLDGQGPDVPDTSDAIFSEAFPANSLGNFTIENITKPAAISEIWKASASYGAVATAYDGQAKVDYAGDARLISPEINLGSAAAPTLTFEHAVNFFTDIATARSQVYVEVRTDGGEWEKLDGIEFPSSLGWTFSSAGNLSLAKYAGKKIRIAFHYTSTAAKAGTWEVKNVVVK